MMNQARHEDTGRLALAIGIAAAGSAVCLTTYFAVQGPFGTINDIGNAATGVLSAGLAWRLRRQIPGRAANVAVSAAIAGAALTVAGSTLVVSGTTGYFLAGLVSSVGFAGIGTWLVVLNKGDALAAVTPRRLRILGIVAGALMALGIAAGPGIVLGLDDMASAPAWVWIGLFGWLGIFVAYPAWAIWLGSVERAVDQRITPRSRPRGSRRKQEAPRSALPCLEGVDTPVRTPGPTRLTPLAHPDTDADSKHSRPRRVLTDLARVKTTPSPLRTSERRQRAKSRNATCRVSRS